MTTETISILRPDDWHIHLRDGQALSLTAGDVSRYYGRAIVMPNLVPPVTTAKQADEYRSRIVQHLTDPSTFTPLMTLYLTDRTDPQEIRIGHEKGIVTACKLYPAGATTNSDSGVTDIKKIYSVLEVMQELSVPLLVHGEVTDREIDIFDREKIFIDKQLKPLLADFPDLKVVFEHITTAEAAQFVEASAKNVAATITAHHLLYERNHMLVGGIRPHLYCLPILKRRNHQEELIRVATSGNTKFFLGSDSAPHVRSAKEASCGCAGCYTGYASLELYAEVFDRADALNHLEAFASINGPKFYSLPINQDHITLLRDQWTAPAELDCGSDKLVPLRANEQIHWRVQ